MKKDIHPNYRPVVFQDNSADFAFLTKSTVETKETITWTDGKEYPLVRVDISSQSHPFYTGKQNIVDTAGRVDRFKARQAAAKARREALVNKAKKANAAAAAKAQQAADDKTSDNNAKPAKTSKKAKKQVNKKN